MSMIKGFIFTTRDDRNVVIRSLDAGDAQAALAFLEQVLRESDSLLMLPGEIRLTVEQEAETIERFRADEGALMFGAFEGGRCVAICNASRNRARAKVGHHAALGVSILAEYHGVGLGSRIMRVLCDWADRHAFIEKLSLSVMADNPVAIKLYKRFGFVQVGKLSQHFRQPDGRYVDDILMERYRRVPVGNAAGV
jgi:RimJ/RimL family protein N-acetyltransferase